jgi:hypothetical protein
MLSIAKRIAFTLAASFVLTSCAKGDYATITISYPAQAQSSSDQWRWPDVPLRQRISKSFWKVAQSNGYKCRAHVKRVEEITCRGPKDMYVTFEPSLNKPEFVAKFNWIEFDGRTADEFKRHISRFSSSLTTTIDDKNVDLMVSQS